LSNGPLPSAIVASAASFSIPARTSRSWVAVASGIAHLRLAQAVHQVLFHLGEHGGGREDPPDRGALLACLLGDVADHVLQEHGVRLRPRRRVRAEDRGVEAVGLDVHPHRALRDAGHEPDRGAGVARAGEGHHVLAAEVGEQIARRAGEERERALGQEVTLGEDPHDPVGEQRGAGGRFADHGHAGEDRDGRLLGEAPGGEVEGVDVHRDAPARDAHVLAEEAR
jgi:hypothetical protein